MSSGFRFRPSPGACCRFVIRRAAAPFLVSFIAGCGGMQPGAGSSRGPSVREPVDAHAPPSVQRVLRVAVRLDARYALIAGAERRARATLDAAATALRRQAGIELSVVDARRFEHDGPTTDALRLLEALERDLDPGVELTVLFSAAAAPRPVRAEHVGARAGGPAVLVRSLALYFDPADQASLAAAEAHLLLEGIGTALGALPFCGDPVMSGRFPPPPTPPAFGNGNARLLTLTSGGTIAQRPTSETALAVLGFLGSLPDADRRCARRLIDDREALLAVIAAPAPEPPALPPAPPGEGPAAALERCRGHADARPESEAARCAGLAADALGRREDAIRYLRGWLSAHGHDVEVVLSLARILGRGGDDGAARALLAEHVVRYPDAIDVWLNLGVAEARLGHLSAARTAWSRVLALDPAHADARALLEKLPPAD
jgi:tetratricopeptide (TPR) repeat protein